MKTSEQINEVAAALALAQAAMRPAIKDATNPAFRSKYADLAAVWDAAREPLTKQGLAVVQDVCMDEGGIAVTTRLLHKSGQWMEFGPLVVPLAKRDAHGVGSATTYAKRYSFCACVGIAAGDVDDDGNAAVAKATTYEPPKAPAVPTDAQMVRLQELRDAAINGTDALKAAWTALDKADKTALAGHLDSLKAAAATADEKVPA